MASMLYSHLPQVIGIVGAGQMGTGIAQICATKGLEVVLNDRSKDILDRGIQTIKASLKRIVRKGQLAEDAATEAVGRIRFDTSMEVGTVAAICHVGLLRVSSTDCIYRHSKM